MKPQKKAAVARKAVGTPTVTKKRRAFPENLSVNLKREKKSKKQEKVEDSRRKMDGERKKLEKLEEKKKLEEKRKLEDKRKIEERLEKADERKKQCKEQEEESNDGIERKALKAEEKCRIEKQYLDGKKKIDKIEEKKKVGKLEEEEHVDDLAKSLSCMEEKDTSEDKTDVIDAVMKKKKDTKSVKLESKENSKTCIMAKEKKIVQKKLLDKEIGRKVSPIRAKKESKGKHKKCTPKKTVLVNKMTSHSPVSKKLIEKKVKLVKKLKKEETLVNESDNKVKKTKKKNLSVPKCKVAQDKKPKLVKQMKAKLSQKLVKLSSTLKKEEKLRKLTEKIGIKKKVESKDTEKVFGEHRKVTNREEALDGVEANDIKKEIDEDKEEEKRKEDNVQIKSLDNKRMQKSIPKSKVSRKSVKKSMKSTKVPTEDNDRKSTSSDDVPLEELLKQSKMSEDGLKSIINSKQEQGENSMEIDLKVETVDGESIEDSTSSLDSEDEDEEEHSKKKNKRKFLKKRERKNSSSDERARRMRLFGFWSGPKRHRVASLNALAKVHCLYENEAGGVYLGGFCKPKSDKEKQKKNKEEKEEQNKEKEIDDRQIENRATENTSKRQLRNVPGLRGKHWDMMESSSSSSSSSDDDYEREKNTEWKKKKKIAKKRKKNEEVMDLKDMVVCKRMASLNASAILAASYSDEKNHRGSSSCSDSSSESEVEIIKRRKQSDSEAEKQKSRHSSDPEEVIKPSKKVVIVNQDTDVTITGVYVNQTRSTHHEGFCSIAGMQYRISSTSHTQTAATAVATELHEQPKPEQPCKSYTPLGALSSMQPPGSQGNHPPMSPRRHSAFSAPHQHGYYQPAGPLIQHPPTLPPVKGPPPEPTPTPPQNSEGSDDLVATSTTSGGTNSTDNSRLLNGGGGFYRAYCPQYYGTPPQYQELCYPPTYSHPHSHPPPYYKYAPTYRRQYYGYQETGGPGSGGPVGGGPGVVEYQAPPPPAEYPPPPYYGGYPPPPPPPPPPPNPAYLHAQGRPFVDHAAFQGCPCPMQSCPKNVDTGPLIGNGKGAPVVSGPGLSLPPSALVGPPSPARGLAGLAPPHGANAWDTDRVQINTHRNLNQNQQPPLPSPRNLVGGRNHPQNTEYRTKGEKNLQDDKLRKCSCQKHACTSTCEVKMESLSPTEKLSVTGCPSNKLHSLKLENNNVKCESCSEVMSENLSCAANCNVKCESGYKCEMLKCEQCVKEGQMAILDIDKDSGILLIDDKLESDTGVKEELNDVVVIENDNWKKADYEPTVQETVEDKEVVDRTSGTEEQLKCQKVTKRKLSLDSLSDNRKKRKVSKRTLSVGSVRDLTNNDLSSRLVIPIEVVAKAVESAVEASASKRKQTKKNIQSQKRKADNYSNPCEILTKKCKVLKPCSGVANCLKHNASETSIMETIDTVIQQSLQMTQKQDRKLKNNERTDKKKKTKKSVNLLSTIKKVSKKMELVKMAVSEKLSFSKAETKCNQSKCKTDAKTKLKTQDAKSKSKPKAKICVEVKSKVLDVKSKVQDSKSKDVSKKSESVPKAKVSEVNEDVKKLSLVKKRRKSTKKTSGKKASGKLEDTSAAEENLNLLRKPFLKPKWSNGWSWEGEPYEAKVYLTNEESAIRRCYESMKHVSGDVLRPRDCVLLKSGPRKADLPFVAKIAALWENPDDGEMMFSLLWYYRPEHTEQGRTEYDTEDEVFASRHRDANSVACIEDKCYILTFNEYCRYRKNLRRIEEGLESPGLIVPPGDQVYPRENRQPPIPVPSDMVLFCRRVYDYRGKKLVKNPG